MVKPLSTEMSPQPETHHNLAHGRVIRANTFINRVGVFFLQCDAACSVRSSNY